MANENPNDRLGKLIKKLLKERALSMRQLGILTNIDPATVSRIINGKQPPKQKHLQKFAECLQVPPQLLFDEMYPDSPHINKEKTDMYTSLDTIQQTLQSSNLFDFDYTTTRVKQELENYERYAQTTEGENRIRDSFASKLEQIDSAYPFIEQLTDMYQQFCNETISKEERAVLGSALLYFILSTDIIPDYLFPIGYLDDAIAVELAKEKLLEMKRKT